MTKRIPLTHGKFALVDDEDFAMLNQWVWHVRGQKNVLYAARSGRVSEGEKYFQMHEMLIERKAGMVIDHINGDGLDNRKSNLRLCTNQENTRNRGANKNNKIGYKGVSFLNKFQKYLAQISVRRRNYYLGLHEDPAEAARAYDAKARELFGDFAYLNFPKEKE